MLGVGCGFPTLNYMAKFSAKLFFSLVFSEKHSLLEQVA